MNRRTEPRLRTATADSPCVQVCAMHPDGSHCVGCFRTITEIGAWSTYSTEQRETVLRQLDSRRQQRLEQRRQQRSSKKNARTLRQQASEGDATAPESVRPQRNSQQDDSA